MTEYEMEEAGFANIDSFKKNADGEFYHWNPYNNL